MELHTINLLSLQIVASLLHCQIYVENKTLTFKYTNWYKAKTNSYKDVLTAMLQLYATYVICTTKKTIRTMEFDKRQYYNGKWQVYAIKVYNKTCTHKYNV